MNAGNGELVRSSVMVKSKKGQNTEESKDATSAVLMKSRLGEDVKLEDFKIQKVLDKGSFGKVFLVVNKNNGQKYAMKRINKDILIEKG